MSKCTFDFAESVLPIYERDYPDDPRPRAAIEAKRAWVRGEISDQKLAAADAARAAAWAAARAAAKDAARDEQLAILLHYIEAE